LQIEHLARALIARNFRPILLPTSKEADTSAVIGQLLHYAVSGVIVTSDAPPTEICEQCAAEGVPIVLINKGDDIPFVDRIVSDDRMAGHLAADHLIDSGAGRSPSWPHRPCPIRHVAAAMPSSVAAGSAVSKRGCSPLPMNDYQIGYEIADLPRWSSTVCSAPTTTWPAASSTD
jgi:hypothetical protein